MLSFDLYLNLLAAPNAFVLLEHLRSDLLGDFHCFPLLLLFGLHIAQLLRLPPGLNDQLTDELNRDPKFPGHLDLAQALDHVAMDDVNHLVRRELPAMAFLVLAARRLVLSCSRSELLLQEAFGVAGPSRELNGLVISMAAYTHS